MLGESIDQINVMSQNICCQEINWRRVVVLRIQVLMAYLETIYLLSRINGFQKYLLSRDKKSCFYGLPERRVV